MSESGPTSPPARRAKWSRGDWLLLIVAVALGSAALIQQRRCTECSSRISPAPPARLTVSMLSEKTLGPMVVRDPAQLRWRDVGDIVYSDEFRAGFSYDEPSVAVTYEPGGSTLRGRLTARGLKPWFVYQLKLVGPEPVRGTREADNDDAATWSSRQLGRMGRWWCEDCGWNVSDEELADHITQGHDVRGYVLFDWFMTDAAGDAEREFALDRSLHVLWKVGQRDREPHDGDPRWYTIERETSGYIPADRSITDEVGVYGEWEPTRADLGRLTVPPGEYRVRLNLTEETWHANMPERDMDLGGFWAWVMDADLRFTVADEPAVAAQPAARSAGL